MSLIRLTQSSLTHLFQVENLLLRKGSRWWPSFLNNQAKRLTKSRKFRFRPFKFFRSFKFNLKRQIKWKSRRKPLHTRALYCVLRHKRNNLFITCYNQFQEGNLLFSDSIGRHGLRGPKKRTLFAAQTLAKHSKHKLNKINKITVPSKRNKRLQRKYPLVLNLVVLGQFTSKVKGALKDLKGTDYKLNHFIVKPINAHNGVRGKKQIRTKRKRRRR